MTVREAAYGPMSERDQREVRCPACGTGLGRITEVTVDFAVGDGWAITGIGDEADAQPDWEAGPRTRRRKTIGTRLELAEGFVNAKGLHPETGHPWYVRSRRPSHRRAQIKPPATVTCQCGQDAGISGVTREQRRLAQVDTRTRQALLESEIEAEGADLAAEYGLDHAD